MAWHNSALHPKEIAWVKEEIRRLKEARVKGKIEWTFRDGTAFVSATALTQVEAREYCEIGNEEKLIEVRTLDRAIHMWETELKAEERISKAKQQISFAAMKNEFKKLEEIRKRQDIEQDLLIYLAQKTKVRKEATPYRIASVVAYNAAYGSE